MANWCENRLKIAGRKDEVLKFAAEMLFHGKTFEIPAEETTRFGPKFFTAPEGVVIDFNQIEIYPDRFREKDVWAKHFLDLVAQGKQEEIASSLDLVSVESNRWEVQLECVVDGRKLTFVLDAPVIFDYKTNECVAPGGRGVPERRFGGNESKKAALFMAGNPAWYSDGFNSGGYEWKVAHYGVKWDGVEEIYWRSKTGKRDFFLYLAFDTPWSPPRPFIRTIIAKYPELRFSFQYREDGNGIRGCILGKNGRERETT